jgi:hypothetical protein
MNDLNDRVYEQQLSYVDACFLGIFVLSRVEHVIRKLHVFLIGVPVYTTIPLSPVFSVYVMENAHRDLQNANTASGR